MTADNSSSFKYKSNLLKRLTTENGGAGTNAYRLYKNAQTIVPLKYLSSFFRSAEILFINTKLHIELNWTKNSVMSNVDCASTFKITKTEMHVPVVNLNTNNSLTLIKLLSIGFQRPIFWNEYKSKIQTKTCDNDHFKRILPDASFQGVNRLFVAAYNNTNGNNKIEMDTHKKYILPIKYLTKFNVLIDGRNVYNQPISDEIRNYDQLRNSATGKSDDYTTGSLLDYKYFKDRYNIISCDLSKQTKLDADPRSTQQIECNFILNSDS